MLDPVTTSVMASWAKAACDRRNTPAKIDATAPRRIELTVASEKPRNFLTNASEAPMFAFDKKLQEE
jgi:hypothetical protein